jgi:asparagine synthase (glutamine-hydrolysing)
MFAFAIYDPTVGDGQLFLARDHFGIKPLYWSCQNNVFLFASEIRALLASDLVGNQVNPAAIWDYLSVGSVIPPQTIVSGVFALLPGHAMLVNHTEQRIWRWWDLAEAAQQVAVPTSYEDAVCEVRRLLDECVRLQRISDVPVGAFLSGGLDSSAIVGLMSAHVNEPIRTFSVAFRTHVGHADELNFARIVSAHFGTIHHEVVVAEEEIAQRFDELLLALDQPSVDGINTFLVAEAARQHITVSLSGVGGDELFAGYPQFGRFLEVAKRMPKGSRGLQQVSQVTGRVLPGRWRIPLEFWSSSPASRHSMIRRFYTQPQKATMLNPSVFENLYARTTDDFYGNFLDDTLDAIAQVSYVEVRGYMAHTLLRDVDAMSMAHSLEVRVPFVDHELARFVFALPPEWKWHNGSGKRILRSALADLLPNDVIGRRKMGFDLPTTDWVTGALRPRLQEALAGPAAKTLLSPLGQQLLQNGATPQNMYPMWSLLVLLRWLELMNLDVA